LPFEGKLRADNRWVKLAKMIPWDKIEARYANLFPSNRGQVAKPVRMALGALTHKINDRIVSISQPHVRPIVRGKATAETEFGASLPMMVLRASSVKPQPKPSSVPKSPSAL
jgi:hypothetical protein